MNLPNTLTVARIFLVPLLVSVLLTKFEGRLVLGLPVELVAAAIFGLASLTDWLDGYLARRRKQVTTLGQILDPLADKLLISATLISLVQLDLVQSWMVAVIISREIAVTGLRNLAYSRGLTMPASGLGKLKMASQVTAILLLLLGWERVPLLVTMGQGGDVAGGDHGAGLRGRLRPGIPARDDQPRRTRSPTSKPRSRRERKRSRSDSA